MLASSWYARPRAQEISKKSHAYSLLFHPSHCSGLSSLDGFPGYLQWKSLVERDSWKDEGLLYDIGNHYMYCNLEFLGVQAWIEGIRQNPIFTEKLSRTPHLAQAVEEILENSMWTESILQSRRLRWLKMLAAMTRGCNQHAMGVVTVKMVADLFRAKYNRLLELAREAKIQGNRAADVVLCEELGERYPWHGRFREILSNRLHGKSDFKYVKAIWTRLITKYPCQPRFLAEYAKLKSGETETAVRFIDHQCFQSYRGIGVAPFDPWKGHCFRKPIGYFRVCQNTTTHADLYRVMAQKLKVKTDQFRLWLIGDSRARPTARLECDLESNPFTNAWLICLSRYLVRTSSRFRLASKRSPALCRTRHRLLLCARSEIVLTDSTCFFEEHHREVCAHIY